MSCGRQHTYKLYLHGPELDEGVIEEDIARFSGFKVADVMAVTYQHVGRTVAKGVNVCCFELVDEESRCEVYASKCRLGMEGR